MTTFTLNHYYMNGELGSAKKILGYNTQPSEYQKEIDEYLEGGGVVTYCAQGERTTEDIIPEYKSTTEEHEAPSLKVGHSLFDSIELAKGNNYNRHIERMFDKRGSGA
tara:strand:+ start:1561 stop:1884 length:324 start_codon:yes stop_codon:yes gene_type:complete